MCKCVRISLYSQPNHCASVCMCVCTLANDYESALLDHGTRQEIVTLEYFCSICVCRSTIQSCPVRRFRSPGEGCKFLSWYLCFCFPSTAFFAMRPKSSYTPIAVHTVAISGNRGHALHYTNHSLQFWMKNAPGIIFGVHGITHTLTIMPDAPCDSIWNCCCCLKHFDFYILNSTCHCAENNNIQYELIPRQRGEGMLMYLIDRWLTSFVSANLDFREFCHTKETQIISWRNYLQHFL